jgi:serine/threonine protein kinase
MTPKCFSKFYRPPEITETGANPYSYGADIWSVGCIIVELALMCHDSQLKEIADLFMIQITGKDSKLVIDTIPKKEKSIHVPSPKYENQ